MIGLVTKGLSKIFGSKSDKDIKTLMPIVEEINTEYKKLSSISDDELRGKTEEIKSKISAELKSIDDEIASLKEKVNQEGLNVSDKEAIYDQIDEVEKTRDKELEVILMDVLPQAFAVVKETARRWKENGKLTVTATMLDKQIAASRDGIEIDGDKAIWNNKWTAAGAEVSWDMLHYDVQLVGGIVLHQGKIAEMATGEGKTLVSTLPAYLNALAGRGVHLITVNDYLAKRDSEWMGPLFEFHGLKVDCIDKHQPNSEERRQAYLADITYGTNNEFGFDYLRDNMSRTPDELVQRKHHFAMVDEVDSVLIDDARTPLIISGPVPKGDVHEFDMLKPRIQKLVDAQRKLVQSFLTDAKKAVSGGNEKDAGLPMFRAYRGLPKNKPLIKFLSEQGNRQILQKTENYYLQDNQRFMPEADEPLLFTIDEKSNAVNLTEKGLEMITGSGEDPNFFILPDLSTSIAAIENDSKLTDEEKANHKDQLINDFSAKTQRIHTVNQLLKAYTLFEKDTEYILQDNQVKIVDEQTGRVMDGRRYSDGLHQAIEAKENVKIEDATQTYATVTLQNYFRMYHKLSGMTGTAETEAGEFWDIYELDVVVIPTNRPIARDDRQDLVYKTQREKFNAVAEEIVKLTAQGRPVLVGTTSVEISELLGRMLQMKGITHNILNAKQHQREADIVAEAGKAGQVTIATNMAGRGTDIKLSDEVKKAGGLAIIGTERHESRRVDRQLRGRAGRQGDPGSSQFYVSLEDNLMRLFGSERIAKLMDRMGYDEGEVIQHSMITKSIERAQKKVEENNFGIRKRLLEYDDVMNSQREVIYARRRNALKGERLEVDILNMIFEVAHSIVQENKATANHQGFKLDAITRLALETKIDKTEFETSNEEQLAQKLFNEAYKHYTDKKLRISHQALPVLKNVMETRGATVQNIVVPFTDEKKRIGVTSKLADAVESEGRTLLKDLEKSIALATIDQAWTEHLREMDDLKQSVQNAVYEQKDPLLIYKFESFELFQKMLGKLGDETISFLTSAEIPIESGQDVNEAAPKAPEPKRKLNINKEQIQSVLANAGVRSNDGGQPQPNTNTQEPVAQMPAKSEKVYGRNDRVKVQYQDGTVKEDVKFKSVENDVNSGQAVIIE